MQDQPHILSLGFFTFFEKYLREVYRLVDALQTKVLSLTEELADKTSKLASKQSDLEAAEAEIRRLKKLPKKPDIKASELDKPKQTGGSKEGKKRAGSEKKSKKKDLQIHEEKEVKAKDIPSNWILRGYKPYVIQDMLIRPNNILYQREIWQSPDGKEQIVASLPDYLAGKQFGPSIQAYILQQYYDCAVSQPALYISLQDYGIQISKGQINNILIENKESFHQEKRSLLAKAIELKEELRTDDTGARHQFKNGYCNCINSDLFTYFTTTYSKSRINFLEILRLNRTNYEINEAALAYVTKEGLAPKYYKVLETSHILGRGSFKNEVELQSYFTTNNWTAKYALKTITEALLIGSIVAHGFDEKTLIHSDGAGQFNLFLHSLCWKHAERPLVKLFCYNEEQQNQLEQKKNAFWSLYQDLKAYKLNPDPEQIPLLEKQFDALCETLPNYASLNQVLQELKKKKDKLLLVLDRPKASLHNNDSERDIREYVKRRKISAGTRSENGRKARDTFLSLKKTCRKLGVSFWDYLVDRLTHADNILPLCLIMEQRSMTANA